MSNRTHSVLAKKISIKPTQDAIRPMLVFVASFALLMVLFYWFSFTAYWSIHIQPHILFTYANLAGILLNMLGENTTVFGEVISSSQFAVNVKRGCDAIEPMALFSSFIIVFPKSWKQKLLGLSVGLSLLFILNIIRIITLFLMGVYYPDYFDYMHLEIWQLLFIILSFLICGIWMKYPLQEKN